MNGAAGIIDSTPETLYPDWVPPPSEAAYYSIPSPSSTQSALAHLFAPLSSAPRDQTYGRQDLPLSPAEEKIREEFEWRVGRCGFVDAVVGKGKGRKGEVAYTVWLPKVDNRKDLVFCHGINDYGAKFSEHARHFLDQGYRVIVPDLPAHGRSSGIHVFIEDMDILANAVYAVLGDLLKHDEPSNTPRRSFIAGQSLGGFVAVLTCIKYGTSKNLSGTEAAPTEPQPTISGGIFLCPMLRISADSRPPYAIELIAKGISLFAGSFPLAGANKGKNSEDPSVEQQFLSDPQTYHGKLRVATGLAILTAITNISTRFSELTVPFSLHHGTGDRVTSHLGSEALYKEAPSVDKEINLYEGFEHIMLRKGKTEADDSRRQRVLNDMLSWLDRH